MPSLLSVVVAAHEALEPQVADLLHLLDGARPLLRARVLQALAQLLHDGGLGVHPRADDEREAEALLVRRVEARHARGIRRVHAVQAGLSLLLAGLRGQRAAPQLLTGQVRVAPEDTLFTCRETYIKSKYETTCLPPNICCFIPNIMYIYKYIYF